METLKNIFTFKSLGIILIIIGLVGFCTVADELRHSGEFIAVSCITISGILFFIVGLDLSMFKKVSLQYLAYSILLSCLIGGMVFDDMPISVAVGIVVGVILAFYVKRKMHPLLKHSSQR